MENREPGRRCCHRVDRMAAYPSGHGCCLQGDPHRIRPQQEAGMFELSFPLPLAIPTGLCINCPSISIQCTAVGWTVRWVHSVIHSRDPLSSVSMYYREVCIPQDVLQMKVPPLTDTHARNCTWIQFVYSHACYRRGLCDQTRRKEMCTWESVGTLNRYTWEFLC